MNADRCLNACLAIVVGTVLSGITISAGDAADAIPPAARENSSLNNPAVPAGIDPGGVPIAIVMTGIDYTDPQIAARLARDGEGELIGWDFVDRDRRPFANSASQTPPNQGGDGTTLAKALMSFDVAKPAEQHLTLMPFRVTGGDYPMIAQAVAYASQTPARTLIVPMTGGTADDWQLFKEAVLRAPALRVVVPDCDIRGDARLAATYPAALHLANLVIVGPGATLDGPYAAIVDAVCGVQTPSPVQSLR
jgi:hypothetical protein